MKLRHKLVLVAGVDLLAAVAGCSRAPAPAIRATTSPSPAPAGVEPAGPPASPAPPLGTPSTSTTSSTEAPTTTTEAPTTTTEPAPPPTTPRVTTVTTVTTGPAATAGGTTSVSWYGDESGSHTANGDRYDPDGLTFAHRSMAFGTAVRFCRGGACVVATCTDRGPFVAGRLFDLSRAAFAAISPLDAGVVEVTWAVVG